MSSSGGVSFDNYGPSNSSNPYGPSAEASEPKRPYPGPWDVVIPEGTAPPTSSGTGIVDQVNPDTTTVGGTSTDDSNPAYNDTAAVGEAPVDDSNDPWMDAGSIPRDTPTDFGDPSYPGPRYPMSYPSDAPTYYQPSWRSRRYWRYRPYYHTRSYSRRRY